MSKETFEGFEAPGTTPVPDIVFDELLRKLTGNELKALLYIIRRTFGFGKNADAISLSQFRKGIVTQEGKVLDYGCGIEHNRTLLVALKGLEEKGCIVSEKRTTKAGDPDTTVYKLRFKKSPQRAPQETSSRGVVTPRNDVVTSGNRGSYSRSLRWLPEVTTVVTSGNQQETVSQETVLQETERQERKSNASNISTFPTTHTRTTTAVASGEENHTTDAGKKVFTPEELTSEERRLHDLAQSKGVAMGEPDQISAKDKGYYTQLAPDVPTEHAFLSLYAFSKARLERRKRTDPSVETTVFLGNMTSDRKAWKQGYQPPQPRQIRHSTVPTYEEMRTTSVWS